MRTLVLVLDHLPPAELNPNNLRRLHWTVRSKVTEVARAEVGWLAKEQWHRTEPMQRASISYEFHIKTRWKSRDLDNLLSSCKPYTDGLVDAGVLFKDDMAHLEYSSIRGLPSDSDKTIITVKERILR